MRHPFTAALVACAALASIASAAVALAQPGPLVIGQKGRQFSEGSVTVRTGAVVRYINDDDVVHNLYVRDPSGTNRPGVVQRPGEQTDVTFDRAGDNQVLCAIHPRMRMTVQVQ